MANIVKFLQNTDHVVRFQKICGVDFLEEQEKSTKNGWANGDMPAGRREMGRCANGVIHHGDEKEATTDTKNGIIYRGSTHISKENGHINGFHRHVVNGGHKLTDVDTKLSNVPYKVTNRFFYYLFCFGANLGNECFYILFYPFVFWNIDGLMARRLCIFWSLYMYLGQAIKDIVRWPRPPSPPVVRMEDRYALEYGMPSTHAMVGAGIPFSLLILATGRYEFPWTLGLLICLVWMTVVCCSRLYLGMHTLLDIVAGLAFIFTLIPIYFYFIGMFDEFMVSSPYSPYVCFFFPLLMCWCYPKLDQWSTARGDTTLVVSVGVGVCIGHWYNFQNGIMVHNTVLPPYAYTAMSWNLLGLILLRTLVGTIVLFITRAALKILTVYGICWLLGIDPEDKKARQRLAFELPNKFFTYVTVAFNTVVLVPVIFQYLGIEREAFYTEI